MMSSTYVLMFRALRETPRQIGVEIQNIFIPLFFFFVTVGAIGEVAGSAFALRTTSASDAGRHPARGPAARTCRASAWSWTRARLLDKLMLTPAPRLSLVLGRLLADGVRVMF
jgi:hypothetical protein